MSHLYSSIYSCCADINPSSDNEAGPGLRLCTTFGQRPAGILRLVWSGWYSSTFLVTTVNQHTFFLIFSTNPPQPTVKATWNPWNEPNMVLRLVLTDPVIEVALGLQCGEDIPTKLVNGLAAMLNVVFKQGMPWIVLWWLHAMCLYKVKAVCGNSP